MDLAIFIIEKNMRHYCEDNSLHGAYLLCKITQNQRYCAVLWIVIVSGITSFRDPFWYYFVFQPRIPQVTWWISIHIETRPVISIIICNCSFLWLISKLSEGPSRTWTWSCLMSYLLNGLHIIYELGKWIAWVYYRLYSGSAGDTSSSKTCQTS